MQGILKFHRGIMKMSWSVKIWLGILMIFNLAGPIAFIRHIEAQVVLTTMFLSANLMFVLTAWYGFTRILGLGHILWFPLTLWLAFRVGEVSSNETFGLWIRGVIILNSASLVIDVVDVYRYFAGDREELVPNL